MRKWPPFSAIAFVIFFASSAFGQSTPSGDAKSPTTEPAVSSASAPGYQATPAKALQWDVVSVRPVEQKSCTGNSGMTTQNDGISIFCVPLLFAIEQAYSIREPSRIVGAPEWVKTDRYNIDAKVAGEDVATYGKLSVDDRHRMLQAMLAGRFRLKAHIEKREMAVYDLVVAKGGSKLKEATAEEAAKGFMVMNGPGKVESMGEQLTSLPSVLSRETGRPVVDKTGLAGKYDFTLEFVPASKVAMDETGGPSIFTAVEEQLGLKLEPAKEPMDVLAIDSIAQPAAN